MISRLSHLSAAHFAVVAGCLAAALAALAATRDEWLPLLPGICGRSGRFHDSSSEDAPLPADAHVDHGPLVASIELSANGLKNIGYQPLEVEPADYHRHLALPAIIVERPGRSQLHVTAPLTGIVTKIHAVTGQAIAADEPLFDLRLTHEELVAAQRELLRTAENLDVVSREIQRLESLDEGVVAGRRILEKKYDKQKLEASLRAEQQAMLLHGINEEQIADILRFRRLFRSLTVYAPQHGHDDGRCASDHLFLIQRMSLALGEQVEAGADLAVLADHCELHIEARAFEDDAAVIRETAKAERKLTARVLTDDLPGATLSGLDIHYVSDQIDPVSRAFKIFLRLPNEVVHEKVTPAGKRYIEWRYKPGQRMQVSIPVETWKEQLVLPATAVVDEGAEAYVYRQNGDQFDQVPVHVLHRDQLSLVVANNGALFRGDIIAGKGAYQMHLALKNKASGGVDPHAGHGH